MYSNKKVGWLNNVFNVSVERHFILFVTWDTDESNGNNKTWLRENEIKKCLLDVFPPIKGKWSTGGC